jgi:hypothetical protein
MSGSRCPLRSRTNASKTTVRLVGVAGKVSVDEVEVLAKCASRLAL